MVQVEVSLQQGEMDRALQYRERKVADSHPFSKAQGLTLGRAWSSELRLTLTSCRCWGNKPLIQQEEKNDLDLEMHLWLLSAYFIPVVNHPRKPASNPKPAYQITMKGLPWWRSG